MAEKHKSKYKAPKDLEKSQKPKTRKDLKDYILDDKDEKSNPKSTKEKQQNVLRKTDKEVIDTGDLYVKYNADDRLYKDLEDAEWEPKHAAKVLKKRQDKNEKDNEKNIKDKIENLTREQHERLVREYVRRKIERILLEADEETADDTETAEAPTPTDAPAPAETPTDAPAPAPAPTAAPAPAPATPEEPSATPEELENRSIAAAANEIAKEGNIGKVDLIAKLLRISTKDLKPEDSIGFYIMLRKLVIRNLVDLRTKINTKTK